MGRNWLFVGHEETDNKSKSTVYLIINKHVVANQQMLWIRFNSNKTRVKDYSIKLQHDGNSLFRI